MKTILLRKLTMAVALFAAVTMSAQQGPTLYDFSSGAQSWVKGYGAGTVAHDAAEGVLMDGALTLERLGNNNANVRRGQGGDNAFVVIDRAVYNYMKVRFKNETAANSFRVQGQSRAVGGTPANFPNIFVGGIPTLSNEFTTVYVDLSLIPAGHEVTRLDILVRQNADVDPAGSVFVFDEIEFLAALPPVTTSEYVTNPDFEGPTGISHYTGSQSEMTRTISSAEQQNGLSSLKLEFTGDASKNNWLFTAANGTGVYSPAFNPASELGITMWVKKTTNYDRSVVISVRTDMKLGGDNSQLKPIASATTTPNTNGAWEQLSFTLTSDATVGFDEVNMWFAVSWTDGDPDGTNALNGDVIYIDNIVAAPIVNGTLGIEKISKDDASVKLYPNPVRDVLNITAEGRNVSKIEVYSILGRKVLDVENTKTVNVSTLSRGVYVSKIYGDDDSVSTKRFVKE